MRLCARGEDPDQERVVHLLHDALLVHDVRLLLVLVDRRLLHALERVDMPGLLVPHLLLNMFCQYIYLRMYVIPAADL